MLEREDEAEGVLVRHSLQLLVVRLGQRRCNALEDVAGDGGDHGVKEDGLLSLPGQLQAHPAGIGDDALDGAARLQLPTQLTDALNDGLDPGAERAQQVAQHLPLGGPGAPGGEAEVDLVPEPGHDQLVVHITELSVQEGTPDHF